MFSVLWEGTLLGGQGCCLAVRHSCAAEVHSGDCVVAPFCPGGWDGALDDLRWGGGVGPGGLHNMFSPQRGLENTPCFPARAREGARSLGPRWGSRKVEQLSPGTFASSVGEMSAEANRPQYPVTVLSDFLIFSFVIVFKAGHPVNGIPILKPTILLRT